MSSQYSPLILQKEGHFTMPNVLAVPREVRELVYAEVLPQDQIFSTFVHILPPGEHILYTLNSRGPGVRPALSRYSYTNIDGRYCGTKVRNSTYNDRLFRLEVTSRSGGWGDSQDIFEEGYMPWKVDIHDPTLGQWFLHDAGALDDEVVSQEYEKARYERRVDYAKMKRGNSLLYTCRLICDEASPFWYGRNTFSVDEMGIQGLQDLETFSKYLSSRSDFAKDCIRKVNLYLRQQPLLLRKLIPHMLATAFSTADTEPLWEPPTAILKLRGLQSLHIEGSIDLENCKCLQHVAKVLDVGWLRELSNYTSCTITASSCRICNSAFVMYASDPRPHIKRQRWDWSYEHGAWKIARRYVGEAKVEINSLNDNILAILRRLEPTIDGYGMIAAALNDLEVPYLVSSLEREDDEFDLAEALKKHLAKPKCYCGMRIAVEELLDAQCQACELVFFCKECREVDSRLHDAYCIPRERNEDEKAVLQRVKELVDSIREGRHYL